MSIEEKQRSGAMRLFEAFSGVDESLLIKCEDAGAEGAEIGCADIGSFDAPNADVGVADAGIVEAGNKIIGWNRLFGGKTNLYRAAGIMAAAVCVVAVGITWWSGTPQLVSQDKASSAECAVEDVMEQAVPEAAPAEAPAAAIAEGSGVETAEAGTVSEEALRESEKLVAGREDAKNEGAVKENTEDKGEPGATDALLGAMPTPQDNRRDITLTEARNINILGEYIPDKPPKGYVPEYCKVSENAESGKTENIALCWMKGMDSIEIYISMADLASVTLTDVDKPETYDVHLYDIPYAQTVPEKYRQQFSHPVFKSSDMSFDIVNARMKSVADAGDTSTPRGNFEVVYEDGVLVRFTGDGSAEEIWEMFAELGD